MLGDRPQSKLLPPHLQVLGRTIVLLEDGDDKIKVVFVLH